MKLSNNIISDFVKTTNDRSVKKGEQNKIYGTVIIQDDNVYVQLDGSEILTPVDSTVHIKNGERVIVSIQNHIATIEGNISDISASNDTVVILDGDMSDAKDVIDYMFLDINEQLDSLDKNISGMDGSVSELNENITEINSELDEIDSRLNGITNSISAISSYAYENEITINGNKTTTVTLSKDKFKKETTDYAVIFNVKTYDFGDTWDGIVTQKMNIYITNKTKTSFDIVTDITGLRLSDSSQMNVNKITLLYTVIV
mgnify:CR=1 FL=1